MHVGCKLDCTSESQSQAVVRHPPALDHQYPAQGSLFGGDEYLYRKGRSEYIEEHQPYIPFNFIVSLTETSLTTRVSLCSHVD